MYYLMWDENSISGLSEYKGCVVLYTEVSSVGEVLREIGLNNSGKVCHRFPSLDEERGLFDNQKIEPSSLKNDIAEDQFFEIWGKVAQ